MPPRPTTIRAHASPQDSWCITSAPPAPHLAAQITGYSHYTEQTRSFAARREMPATMGVLIINLGPALAMVGGNGDALRLNQGEGFVAGLHLSPAISRATSGAQSGIHVFLSLPTLGRLLGLNMADIVDRVVDLRSLLGPAATSLGERLAGATPTACFDLLDEALAPRLHEAPPPDRTATWALSRLHANPAQCIGDLAHQTGWSRKHLADRIRHITGATPRTYARLRRFERLLDHLKTSTTPHWADLAAAHGFADQPHLARELRDLSGLTPTTLMRRLLPESGGFIEPDA